MQNVRCRARRIEGLLRQWTLRIILGFWFICRCGPFRPDSSRSSLHLAELAIYRLCLDIKRHHRHPRAVSDLRQSRI